MEVAENWTTVRRQKEAKSLFVQGLSECWVCEGAMMLFASVEEQNKQKENAPLLSWRKGSLGRMWNFTIRNLTVSESVKLFEAEAWEA